MKVVILCGGLGTRLAEDNEIKPKPMIEIGGHPIVWHIMKHYAHHGLKEFYIALGHRGAVIKRFFVDYSSLGGSLSVDLASGQIDKHDRSGEDWIIHLRDTGQETNTGMLITTSSGAAITQVDNCRFNALSAGINTTSNAFVHARNCYFASTTSANGGVRANTSCQANVSNSMFVSNNTGVNIAGGTVRLSNNEFYNNVTAVGGGTAESANNNKFRSNTTDGNTSNVIVVK